MPTYGYRCSECEHIFEVFQRITDDPVAECERCGAKNVRRLLYPVGIVFKGSGFHVNDYRKPETKKSEEESKPESVLESSTAKEPAKV